MILSLVGKPQARETWTLRILETICLIWIPRIRTLYSGHSSWKSALGESRSLGPALGEHKTWVGTWWTGQRNESRVPRREGSFTTDWLCELHQPLFYPGSSFFVRRDYTLHKQYHWVLQTVNENTACVCVCMRVRVYQHFMFIHTSTWLLFSALCAEVETLILEAHLAHGYVLSKHHLSGPEHCLAGSTLAVFFWPFKEK